MIKRILVPIDFSRPSLEALDYAIELNRLLKADLILVHALEPIYYPIPADISGLAAYDMGPMLRELERAGREQLAKLTAKLRQRRIDARVLQRAGTASAVIEDSAKKLKADLIVMSTHGRTGLSHVLMGSVAEKVVRHAPCPVLTVRGRVGRKHSGRRKGGSRRGS